MQFPLKSSAAPQRVVVTGAGVVTALGVGWRVNAAGFRAGRRAFRPVTLFAVSRQRAKVAGDVDLPTALPPTRLSARTQRRLNRPSRLLLWAASEAWEQAGWEPGACLPQVLGTTSCGMESGAQYYRQALAHPVGRRGQATRGLYYQAQRQALDLAEAFGFHGPTTLLANACAAGSNAVGHAWELVRQGRAERVLTGGYDALSQLVFAGFDSLQALSTTTCRPFDARRDGLALGEGAAVLALESLDHAQRRGATILGEMIGYGAATDAHHLTQPHPSGEAAYLAMQEACRVAGLTPDGVGYVNAHGTGTPLNDTAEALAINRWAGPHAASIPVSSTKGSVGHLLGAAGAVEAVVCLMVLREQWLPPEPFVETVDPACAFPLVREPRDAAVEVALSNSFGFGGANASLIFRRWR
jgi:3-oxoacyl-[acyl-carrier-protein] synthase II